MSTTPIPMPQQQGPPGSPDQYAAYIREAAAQQANTTGLTQIAPNLSGARPPAQTQQKPPGEQQNQAFGPGQGGANKRQSAQNLMKSIQGVAQQFSQAQQAKQQREYEQVITKYTGSVAGITQAQAQVRQGQQMLQQAAEKLKANPQDPEAHQLIQQGQQLTQQGRQALQVNQTNLNDMANDKKQHKVITKAFGIDDKNASSPERQAAIATLKKQLGVGDAAAGIASHLPQTQQLSPQGQAQQLMQQSGVMGKPATQGQILTQIGKLADDQIKQGIAADKLVPQLAKAGLQMKLDDKGEPIRNEDGTLQIAPQTPDQRALNPVLRSQDAYKESQTRLNDAKTALARDPKNIQNVARMMNARSNATRAQASMLHAIKYQPGAAGGSPAETGDLVDMFHEGKVDPSQIPGFGKTRTEFLEALHKKYPDDNAAQASEDYKFASNQQTQMVLKGLDNLTGPDGKGGNLQEVVKLSNGIKRTNLPPLNDVAAWRRINTGDPKMAAYYAGVLEVSDQVAKILQGGGTGSGTSDSKLKQAQAILNSGFSPSQITEIAGTLGTLLDNRKKSIIGNNRYLKNQYGAGGSEGSNDTDDPAGLFK